VRGEGDQQAQVRQGIEQGLNLVLQHYISGGLPELVQFVNERFPLERRQGAQEATGQLLERAEYEAINIAQERAGLPPVDISQPDERRDRFYGDALLAMSTSLNYGNEFYLQPVGFTEVKASTFQLTRAPGQPLVYLGSVMLVLGIFCMFYIRENRVWIWLSEGRLLLAFTSNRQDSQTDREFATYQAAIRQLEGISELPT
jgi:cytochrome c biogenesis protein